MSCRRLLAARACKCRVLLARAFVLPSYRYDIHSLTGNAGVPCTYLPEVPSVHAHVHSWPVCLSSVQYLFIHMWWEDGGCVRTRFLTHSLAHSTHDQAATARARLLRLLRLRAVAGVRQRFRPGKICYGGRDHVLALARDAAQWQITRQRRPQRPHILVVGETLTGQAR